MKKGMSSVVAIVLLIGIATIGSLSFFLWSAGLASKQVTPDQKPVPILATPVDYGPGYLKVLVANLGDRDIHKGTVITVAGTDSVFNLTEDIGPGEQKLLTFWGRLEEDGSEKLFENTATLFSPESGITSPPVLLKDVMEQGVEAYNASRVGSTGYDPSVISTRDENGLYWMVFSSDAEVSYYNPNPQYSHDIYIKNSTDGINWGNPVRIAAEPNKQWQEDSPFLFKDSYGTFWVIYRDAEENVLKMVNSSDGSTWSSRYTTNIGVPGNHEFTFTTTNMRGFSFIRDSNDLFWIAYQLNNELIVRNSTDAITWNDLIVVDSSIDLGRVSIIQCSNCYFVAALKQGDRTTVEVFNSTEGNTWTKLSEFTDPVFGEACSGPSLLKVDKTLFAFTDFKNTAGNCHMQVQASLDGVSWSKPSWLPNFSNSDMSPHAIYDNEMYWVAFGNQDLEKMYVRYSTDPMIWKTI